MKKGLISAPNFLKSFEIMNREPAGLKNLIPEFLKDVFSGIEIEIRFRPARIPLRRRSTEDRRAGFEA